MAAEKDKPHIDAITKALGPLQVAIADAKEAGLYVTLVAHHGLGLDKLDSTNQSKPFYVEVQRTLRTKRPWQKN